MKITFDTVEEYDILMNMMQSASYYWKKRLQESQGKFCMTLDDKGYPTTSHYDEDEVRENLAEVDAMWDVISNQTHLEDVWSDEADDWVEVTVEGVAATYVDPSDVEDEEEVIEEEEELDTTNSGKLHLNPRPNLQTDMIEWMSRPEYALARWNLGYKDGV